MPLLRPLFPPLVSRQFAPSPRCAADAELNLTVNLREATREGAGLNGFCQPEKKLQGEMDFEYFQKACFVWLILTGLLTA